MAPGQWRPPTRLRTAGPVLPLWIGRRPTGTNLRLPWVVSRSLHGALWQHAAAVRTSRANGFAVIGCASGDPGHSLLTRGRRSADTVVQVAEAGHQPGGGSLPLDPLHAG
jgi:hypothetical protein